MLKNVSITGAARLAPAMLAFGQSIVVARILGPEAFGVVALIAAYPMLVFGIFNVRTGEATIRFLASYDETGARDRALGLCNVVYAIDMAVALLSLGVVAATAPWLGPRLLKDTDLVPLMIVYAVSFVPNGLGPASNAVLIVTGRFMQQAVLEIGRAAARACLVIGLVVLGWGVTGVVIGTVAANLILGGATAIVAHKAAAARWGASWLGRGWNDLAGHRREIVRYFALSDLSALFTVIIRTVDVLILGWFRPTVEIGYYNLGKSLTTQALSLVGAVRVVAFPEIVRLWVAGQWNALWGFVRSHTLKFGLPGLAGVAVLMGALEPAIALVYGQPFLPAAPVGRLLLLQVALVLLTMWVDMVFLAWGDLHVQVVARATGAVVTAAVTYALVGPLGVSAAAVALLSQQVVTTVITFSWMYSQRGIRVRQAAAKRAGIDRASAAFGDQHVAD